MSTPQTQAASKGKRRKRSTGELTRLTFAAVLAVLITLFAVLNLDSVKVHWILGTSRAPLIIVIVISLLIGGALTYLAERRARKR